MDGTSLDILGEMRTGDRVAGLASRFHRPYRRLIDDLAARSDRLGELCSSFPGLLFALATGHGSVEARARAIDLIEKAAPLRLAADVLDVPWWLRRLPPDAFEAPLGPLPSSPEFCRRITNIALAQPALASGWLQRVSFAYEAAGEAYALWMARQRRMPEGTSGDAVEVLLAVWAWHSQQTSGLGVRLVRKPWAESMGLGRAIEEAEAWIKRTDLAVAIGSGIADPWLAAGRAGGYDFVPLATLEDFLDEARAMGNCLDRYSEQVRFGLTRVYSVRKSGRHVANIEIGAHEDDCSVPQIEQLRGPRNRRVAPEVWQAAYTWLAGQTYRLLPRPSAESERGRQKVLQDLWRPYLAAHERSRSLRRIEAFLLERAAGRRSRR